MKSKPNDRSNNVKTTKTNIERALHNMEFANELIAKTADAKLKSELDEENWKREQALDGLYQEVKDEAKHHKP